MGVWNDKMELIDRGELDQIILERLQATLNRAVNNVPFYHELFAKSGVVPEHVRSVNDLAKLPFTTRDNLVDHQPYGFFAVSLRDIARIHSSSGTTGRPVVVGYTRNDRDHWAECLARILCAIGTDSSDIVQVSFRLRPLLGRIRPRHGGRTHGSDRDPGLGRRCGTTDTRHARLPHDRPLLHPLLRHADRASHGPEGHLLPAAFASKGLFGAEPWSEDVRSRIEEALGISAFDIYGISELMGPGVAGECSERKGLHVWEDHFLPEIIDPETGAVLEPGAEGELVVTTLTRESMPLIRYRTGDITSIDRSPCPCGRPHARIARISHRKSDSIIVRGVNIYVRDVDELLKRMFEIPIRYQLVVSRGDQGDNLEVLIEVNDSLFADELRSYQHRESTIRHELSGRLSFEPTVRFVEPSHFPPSGVKYSRVVDTRNNGQ